MWEVGLSRAGGTAIHCFSLGSVDSLVDIDCRRLDPGGKEAPPQNDNTYALFVIILLQLLKERNRCTLDKCRLVSSSSLWSSVKSGFLPDANIFFLQVFCSWVSPSSLNALTFSSSFTHCRQSWTTWFQRCTTMTIRNTMAHTCRNRSTSPVSMVPLTSGLTSLATSILKLTKMRLGSFLVGLG